MLIKKPSFSFGRTLIMLVCISILISACKKGDNLPSQIPMPLATTTPQPAPGSFTAPDTNPDSSQLPTTTATLLPPETQSSDAANAGLIVFSMADGEYEHLFAYHPSYLPITRLTADAWDDDSPVVSPDGTKIAFTSNRSGTRELYVLNLLEYSITQVTNIGAFVGSICWSPDGEYYVYDVYQNGHFDLIIQSASDPTEAPIQLTDGSSNSFQPAWSPDGSQIAFVSDRSGQNEIWLARLRGAEELFVKMIGIGDADLSHPAWSPDGAWLAFSRHQTGDDILLLDVRDPEAVPVLLGKGKNPVWLPNGSGVLVTLALPNQTEIVAYSSTEQRLLLPPIPMPASLSSYDWRAGATTQGIQTYLAQNQISAPAPLWTDMPSATDESGRRSLVPLDNVTAPQTALSDAVDDSFNELRLLTQEKTGWDVLGILENTTLPPTFTSMPDIPENWLFTGRAFSLNMAPYEAEWMVVTREEFVGETYWRVWLKCKVQDGTCGEPIQSSVWNFDARFSGDPLAYENGGEVAAPPAGYWMDFTDLALRFGWERLPSLNNWRSYFPGIQFNTFVLRQGLTWKQALLEVYSSDQVQLIIEKSQ